jgi:hypothetical protein
MPRVLFHRVTDYTWTIHGDELLRQSYSETFYFFCREERGTDKSISKCRMRYQVFRTHYPALSKLQSVMPFSVIDATGSLEDCEGPLQPWPSCCKPAMQFSLEPLIIFHHT